jgi:4-hydroxythreonine-4-phosphate dehydrogenase
VIVSRSAPIALTMGDPSGIGPEIVVKLVGDNTRPAADLLVVGDAGVLQRAASALGSSLRVARVETAADAVGRPHSELLVLQPGPDLAADLPVGKVNATAGAAAYCWVQKAIDLALAAEVRAIVTAPINKAAMHAAGVGYPGHTEILADRCGVTDFAMMLANDELRVVLVSIHVSLADAIVAVTPEAELRTIRLAHRAGQAFGLPRPRIAVAGLNPHAGENGMFGLEDAAIIAPAVAVARSEGIDASGPWPGDTVFMRARKGEFDIVVAQYHDQGLIPVKYLGVDNGVNATLGLPFVRTSVDHGTAFDIAGKGIADPASLAQALKQAIAMTSDDLPGAE